MKSILISIKPKYVAKILNGEKTIEIKKTMPKCDLPIDVYIYCTKNGHKEIPFEEHAFYKTYLYGKVVAKFTLNKVVVIHKHNILPYYLNEDSVCNKSCLTFVELRKYLKGNNGYAWHISNLVIFDKPKELSEFYTLKCNQKKFPCNINDVFGLEECFDICKECKKLTKAPQSWCYVEVE